MTNKCEQCGLCLDHDDFIKLREWEGVDDATSKQVGTCKDCGIDYSFEYRDFADEKNNIFLAESVEDEDKHADYCEKPEMEVIDVIREDLDTVFEEVECRNCNFKCKTGWTLVDSYPASCERMDNINGHEDTDPCEECHVICDRIDVIMP